MIWLILVLLLLILFYYFYSIEFLRYYNLKSIEEIDYYDKIYSNTPKVKSIRRVVISMTTIPSRINKIQPTLVSLLNTTRRVDKIYINIPYYSLKGETYKIPKWLENSENITINRVDKDYGPATKLIPVLQKENKKTMIIVVDDDVIYGSKMVENYVKMFYYRKEKDALTIFGSFAHNGKIIEEYPSFLQYRGGCYVNILKGHNSFLVTPEMFSRQVFKISKECLWVDDIWFSGWLKYNDVKIYSLGFSSRNIPITNFDTDESNSLCATRNLSEQNNNNAIRYFKEKWNVII